MVTLRNGKIVGDQKSHGHYDLDGTQSRIVKRPLAASSHLATDTPQPEPAPAKEEPQIIHASSSRIHVNTPKTAAPTAEPKQRASKRRFVN